MKKLILIFLSLLIYSQSNGQIFMGSRNALRQVSQDSLILVGNSLVLGNRLYFSNNAGFRFFNNQLQFSNDLLNWYNIPTSLTQGGGWTLGLNKVYQTTTNTPVHIRNNANDTTATGLLNVYGRVDIKRGSIYLDTTQYQTQYGVIYKNGVRFIHDFNYGWNGTVTTDGNNIFIGLNAGNFTMGSTATQSYHSSYNIGIGSNSLLYNTTGNGNVAIGRVSLMKNTTGSDNVAVGNSSMFNNTTGYNNVALGLYSLYNNTTGYSNTALGYNSLFNNINGNVNNAIGEYSLYNNTSGHSNNVLGNYALSNNQNGSYNVAIGREAGRYASDNSTPITTVNNSVFIGSYARPNANNETNQIVIGYDAVGNGSNSVTIGNVSITKTILGGNIGIGTTNPTAKVDINGTTGYNQLRLRATYTPTGTNDTNGNVGDISWDDNYIYIKTTQGWKRAQLSNF